MKKFIKKVTTFALVLMLCLLALIGFDFFVIGSKYKYSYNASLVDKVDRLRQINEPKIILVGNSNLSFGIFSDLIETEFNMPVVNLGLHGGLGNAFHEEIAKLNINEGDIVVVCNTGFSDNDEISDPSLALITFDNNYSLLPIFRLKDYINLIPAYPNYLKNSISLYITMQGNQISDSSYSRNSFNKYGDIVYRPQTEQLDVDDFFKKHHIYIPQINETCINRMNEFNKYINERGASMVVAGYPIAYGEYSIFDEEDVRQFNNRLIDELDCTVISDYTDYLFPYKYFYNTQFHLTEEGAVIRTNLLIEELKAWLTE